MRSDLDAVLDRAPKAVQYRPLPKVTQRVPYRSQLHYEELVAEVKQCQLELRALVEAAEECSSAEELVAKDAQVSEQRERLDQRLVLLKITSKIFSEMNFARESLQEAIRLGKSTAEIRQRIGWLEQRLERLLNKERPEQVRPKLAILPPPPKSSEERKEEEEEEKKKEEEEEKKKEEEEKKKEEEEREEEKKKKKEEEETEEQKKTTSNNRVAAKEKEEEEEEEESKQKDEAEDMRETFLTECSDDKSVDLELSSSSSGSTPLPDSSPLPRGPEESAAAAQSRAESGMAADEYWSSEHHRVKFAENAQVLLQADPSSYHSLAMVQPGTYVGEVSSSDPALPWRPRRRSSEFEEIHKDALNALSKRVHNMYMEMHDAAMLSVDPHYMDEAVKGTFIDNLANQDGGLVENTDLALPEVRMPKKAGAGATYYPTPLLPPVKLPVAKLDREKQLPPGPSGYSGFQQDTDSPAARIVNQGNLYEDTKFTSSLFRKRRVRDGGAAGRGVESAADEQRLRRWVRESGSPSQASSGAPFLLAPEEAEPVRPSFKNRVLAVRGAQHLAKNVASSLHSTEVGGSAWKNLKPKSSALKHSGLKWERIKEIVHQNLNSPRPLERQDAARSLGLLRCADGMVLFALRKAMMTDEDLQTRYESAKALILLGCWEDVVLQHLVFFLRRGDANVKTHLLKTMTSGRNVQFVDKTLPSFSKLAETLSKLSAAGDLEVAFHASVCLGKLCVADASGREFLTRFVANSRDDDRVVQACETLVRQMNCSEAGVVQAVLHRLRWSPNFKNRCLCARLLVVLGPRAVCASEAEQGRVFELLETRIWDDPMPEVRTEIAKAIIALDMFPRSCERAEKKLESPDEDVRAQAVLSIGTLGIRNERIIRTLLEMLELDPSEYIRILVIRTFGAIGHPDKRIVRSLQEKEKLDGMFANEARKSLKILQASS